jgi:hypothetical protein
MPPLLLRTLSCRCPRLHAARRVGLHDHALLASAVGKSLT